METRTSTWSSMKWVRNRQRTTVCLTWNLSKPGGAGDARGSQQSRILSKHLTEAHALHEAYHADILWAIVSRRTTQKRRARRRRLFAPWAVFRTAPEVHAQTNPPRLRAGGEAQPGHRDCGSGLLHIIRRPSPACRAPTPPSPAHELPSGLRGKVSPTCAPLAEVPKAVQRAVARPHTLLMCNTSSRIVSCTQGSSPLTKRSDVHWGLAWEEASRTQHQSAVRTTMPVMHSGCRSTLIPI